MDEVVAGPSSRTVRTIAGDRAVENILHPTIAVASVPSLLVQPQARAKGSKADLPYLHFNDVKLIVPEEGDSDDEEQNHRSSDPLYCMYCGDISSKKNIRRHINTKHEGSEWTLQSTYSRKKAGRVTALARQKPYIKVRETVAQTDITDEDVSRAKRVRIWKNCMKAKKARDAASNADIFEEPRPQNNNRLQSQEEDAAIANGVEIEDDNAYVPIKPVNEKAFRDEMKDVLSIAALIEKSKSFKVYRAEGYIECVPCKTKHSYNFHLGEAFERGKMHKKFGDLKNVVLHHIFKSASHEIVTSGNHRLTSEEDKLAGKIIGGRIYGFVKSGTKHCQFKEELYKSNLDGSKIGSINHSEYTLSKMLTCLYECHAAYVTKQMNTPNPATGSSYITITADKITLHNITYHCIGLYYVKKNGLENVFLKVLENQGGSGKRLAQEMVKATVDTLGISKDELGKRLVCVATDGQYIRNNVDDRMNEILGNRGDFRTFAWDIGHLIELAAKKSREYFEQKDMRTIKEDWLKNVFVITRTVSAYYRTPKNMQRLRRVASKKLQQTNIDALEDFPEVEEFFESFYSPLTFKKFSDTRWAQFTKNTFYAIIRNFRAMRIDLGPQEPGQTEETEEQDEPILPEDQEESMEMEEPEESVEDEEAAMTRDNESGKTKEQLRNWAKLANAEFILAINGMMDIYGIVTSMSLNAQRSKAFVWHALGVHQELMNNLTKLSVDFPKPIGTEEGLFLRPNFTKAALELRDQQSYRTTKINRLAVPVLLMDGDCDKDKDTFVTGIDVVITDISKKLGIYTVILVRKLNEEMARVPKVLFYTKDAFNIKLIRARGNREAPESLELLFNSSKDFGIYADPALTFEDFRAEYYSFIDYVKSMDSEHDSLYMSLLFNDQIDSFPNVLQLLAASAARSSCEGIIESYGSIMKERLHHRERLGVLKYNSELFLHINGPPVGKADTLIKAAWTRFFRGRSWHFYPRSNPSRLKTFVMSKALDPLQDVTSKFDPMPEDYDLGFTYP